MKSSSNRTNLILIGLPTSGKSTAGVLLAKALGKDFLDTDLLIQSKTGETLSEIISNEGNASFLKIEEAVCAGLKVRNTVIATGGSAVYSERAMKHLKKTGPVVYLEIDRDTLEKRLHDARGRGVVLRDGETLEELFEERTILYRRYADLTVREGDGGMEETVRLVLEALRRLN